MNKQETAEAIIVMQAFVDGAEIESTSAREEWHPIIESVWNWDDCEYRIKPSPREFWINPERMTVWSTKGTNNDCIKVREVLK